MRYKKCLLLKESTSCQITNYKIMFFLKFWWLFYVQFNTKIKIRQILFLTISHPYKSISCIFHFQKYQSFQIAIYQVLRYKKHYKILVFLAFTKNKTNEIIWVGQICGGVEILQKVTRAKMFVHDFLKMTFCHTCTC